MLRSVFGKTLFEKRWVILAWTVAILVINFALVQIFPPMKDAFANMTAQLPDSLKVWFGDDGQIWQSLKGFISMEVMGQMALVVAIFGIIFSSSAMAGEENSGLLLTQLARPISRRSFFWQKYLAFVAATVVLMIGFALGTLFGALVLGETLALGDLLRACLGVLMLGLTLGSLTFAIGAICSIGNIAGVIVGFYAALGYFIVSLRGAADVLTTLSHLTPFYYYNNPNLMNDGFDYRNVLVLLVMMIIPLVVALPIFVRRDLKTR
jgi:ABC-2 type transport system permease protein